MSNATWKPALSRQALEAKGRAVVRLGKKQLALFVVGDQILACNNRCPHEGYPLVEGSVDERCVLTCNWHNWKFDLAQGDNLFGGDRLRVYPTRLDGDMVLVDIAEPPLETQRDHARTRLHEALDDDDYTRVARELARLELLDVDASQSVRDAMARTAPRLEFGWTHAFAAGADWLSLRDERTDAIERLSCAVEACAHLARDSLRQPAFPFPEGLAAFTPAELVQAIEAEDEGMAAPLVRDALARGRTTELMGALCCAALAHYQDFGHSTIYVDKAQALLDRFGGAPEFAEPVLLALVRSLVYAQRDDLLPEFAGYAPALRDFGSGLSTAPEPSSFHGASVASALERVLGHACAPPLELYAVLYHVVAEQMLYFDASWGRRSDRPVSDNVSWLDVTHALTFAGAVRSVCARRPELWPASLLQLACFVGRNERYVDRTQDVTQHRVSDPDAFEREAISHVLDHGVAEPLVSAHLLKTFVAVRAEVRAGYGGELALSALNRFLHAPLKRRHVRRTARQALGFVAREG